MPYWKKLFKAWGIYKVDFHKKYRKYLLEKRYKVYISKVAEDIQNNIRAINKKQIQDLMDRKFPKPEFKIIEKDDI